MACYLFARRNFRFAPLHGLLLKKLKISLASLGNDRQVYNAYVTDIEYATETKLEETIAERLPLLKLQFLSRSSGISSSQAH